MFCLIHFALEKYTFIDTGYQQVVVADNFKKISATKIRNQYFFSAYLVCITKGYKWVKFSLQRVKLYKVIQRLSKSRKKRKELLKHYF